MMDSLFIEAHQQAVPYAKITTHRPIKPIKNPPQTEESLPERRPIIQPGNLMTFKFKKKF